MALSDVVGHKLFTQAWVDGLKQISDISANCEIVINHPTGEKTYDPTTNTYTPVVDVLYAGIARTQTVTSEILKDVPGDATSVRNVQFQLPVDAVNFTLLPDNDYVEITRCDLNPSLLDFKYVVSSVLDSGNPFEYTLMTAVDQEVRI